MIILQLQRSTWMYCHYQTIRCKRLYEILLKYNLITTAQDQRRKLFISSPPISLSAHSTPWHNHTLHTLSSLTHIHRSLRSCKYAFHDVPPTLAIDILNVSPSG